jgi:hypothetical protein
MAAGRPLRAGPSSALRELVRLAQPVAESKPNEPAAFAGRRYPAAVTSRRPRFFATSFEGLRPEQPGSSSRQCRASRSALARIADQGTCCRSGLMGEMLGQGRLRRRGRPPSLIARMPRGFGSLTATLVQRGRLLRWCSMASTWRVGGGREPLSRRRTGQRLHLAHDGHPGPSAPPRGACPKEQRRQADGGARSPEAGD